MTVLASTEIPAEEAEALEGKSFWDELWKLRTTTEQVFEMISPTDVRKLRQSQPENLHSLFDQAICQLCHFIERPLPLYYDHALNCIRVLTRLIPFMLENPGDDVVSQWFWRVECTSSGAADESLGGSTAEPLGKLAVHAVVSLLFLPSFTVCPKAFQSTAGGSEAKSTKRSDDFTIDHPEAVWAAGTGGVTPTDVVYSVVYDRNRVEVLRLMLAILCEPLFVPADVFEAPRARWLLHVTDPSGLPSLGGQSIAPLMFHSLLNTVISFDPVGWGVPYGAQVSRAGEPTRCLEKAAQVLIVLLDYGATTAVHPGTGSAEAMQNDPEYNAALRAAARANQVSPGTIAAKEPPPSPQSPPGDAVPNVFRQLLSAVGSDGTGVEFEGVFLGITRLLNNVHEAQNVYFPGSVMEIECYQEVLVLLWKFLEENDGFMPHILKHCDISQLVVPICYLMFEARRDVAKVGLIHICTFILLKLSGERNFCVQLNRAYAAQLPCDLPHFTGTHTDLLVIVLHKMVVNGSDKLSPLYNCFLTIICNVSPYTKTLCLLSSVKLVNLFELFTSHRFLYAAEGNHVYVALLLEIFNNILQYQYTGNPHLVYSIVRRQKLFGQLAALTLEKASRQAASHARKQLLRSPDAGTDNGEGGGGVPSGGGTNAVSLTSAPTNPTGGAAPSVPSAAATAGTEEAPSTATPDARFVPTASWLQAVKNELPLTTIMRLLQHLVPQVDELVKRSEGTIDETQVMSFIVNTTMVGLLPVPHPIVIRKYTPNHFTGLWFTAFLWGVIFLQNQYMPLYDGSAIKLFTVTVARG
jgi:hypothetical protein